MTTQQTTQIQILDGGMGRELDRRGAPFRRPEWSALALMEEPSAVQAVHEDFINAGANIVTTNSYAVVPFHIGEERFAEQGLALAQLSGKLAKQAISNTNQPDCIVAASIPPLFGSYRPDLFDVTKAEQIANVLIDGLTDYADVWLLETMSNIIEPQTIIPLLSNKNSKANTNNNCPIWVSFSLEDDIEVAKKESKLRSGETVKSAINAMLELKKAHQIEAILFNCSQPEVIEYALQTAQAIINSHGLHSHGLNIKLGAYANAFPPQRKDVNVSEFNNEIRDLTPQQYLEWAKIWANTGATIIGGCCGISPAHIEVMATGLNQS